MLDNAKTLTLKPCPFCGNIPEVIEVFDPRVINPRHNKPFSVYCSGCDTWHGYDESYGGEFDTMDKAVNSWNRRTQSCRQ